MSERKAEKWVGGFCGNFTCFSCFLYFIYIIYINFPSFYLCIPVFVWMDGKWRQSIDNTVYVFHDWLMMGKQKNYMERKEKNIHTHTNALIHNTQFTFFIFSLVLLLFFVFVIRLQVFKFTVVLSLFHYIYYHIK